MNWQNLRKRACALTLAAVLAVTLSPTLREPSFITP